MHSNKTRILTRDEVGRLLAIEDCITAVEEAFQAHARGQSIPPDLLSAHVEGGAFHVKAAGLLSGSRAYFAAKLNGNFYRNAELFGMPRIQGLILLCDARNGYPLAVMDSTGITVMRTAAASAVAAKYLARPDSRVATICGCGLQGRIHLAAIRCVRPIEKAYLFDTDPTAAEQLALEFSGSMDVEVLAEGGFPGGLRQSDICVTCTPSRQPILRADDVSEGAFVAAVGADSEEKQELEVALLGRSRVVVDHLEQCASIGELHHALEADVLRLGDVHAQLHEVVAGRKPGRSSPKEIFVFDSTGVALQDVAAAAIVYERAVEAQMGTVTNLVG